MSNDLPNKLYEIVRIIAVDQENTKCTAPYKPVHLSHCCWRKKMRKWYEFNIIAGGGIYLLSQIRVTCSYSSPYNSNTPWTTGYNVKRFSYFQIAYSWVPCQQFELLTVQIPSQRSTLNHLYDNLYQCVRFSKHSTVYVRWLWIAECLLNVSINRRVNTAQSWWYFTLLMFLVDSLWWMDGPNSHTVSSALCFPIILIFKDMI